MAKKIIAAEGEQGLWAYLDRVFRYRSFIFTLAKRDLKAQYAQTALGLLWTAIQPLVGLLIFTIFFDNLLEIPAEKLNYVDYPLFAFSGMVSWYYFTYLIAHAGTVLINSQDLIKKIYFPKLVLPLSKVFVGIVDFGISLALLSVMMLMLGQPPTWTIIFLPFFILLNIVMGLAVAIWLSALTIRYRDFQHIIPYLVNFGIWLTPVFYPATIIPERFFFVIYLNPMAGVIAGFRWCLLGDVMPSPWYLASIIPAFILFIVGISYFKKVEADMVDVI